ncbi:MAG TPA: hypothetical protein VM783_10670 [Candidatus Acidoferrum sp.]|nr:hypothetical protein [Candidatus Acidoferrum sp.]
MDELEKQHHDQMVRVTCLEAAVRTPGALNSNDVLEAANSYYDFITKTTPTKEPA